MINLQDLNHLRTVTLGLFGILLALLLKIGIHLLRVDMLFKAAIRRIALLPLIAAAFIGTTSGLFVLKLPLLDSSLDLLVDHTLTVGSN